MLRLMSLCIPAGWRVYIWGLAYWGWLQSAAGWSWRPRRLWPSRHRQAPPFPDEVNREWKRLPLNRQAVFRHSPPTCPQSQSHRRSSFHRCPEEADLHLADIEWALALCVWCWQFGRKMHVQCYHQAHGPVYEVEVQVVQFKVTERLLTVLPHHGLLVVSAPQLRNNNKQWGSQRHYLTSRGRFTNDTRLSTHLTDDEEILPSHHAILDHGLNTFSHLCLILVDKRSVDVPVTGWNGRFHRFCDFAWGRLSRQAIVDVTQFPKRSTSMKLQQNRRQDATSDAFRALACGEALWRH